MLNKQAQQKLHHDQHCREQDLEPVQGVMARNFRPGVTWILAVVRKKLGPLTYLVKQKEGKFCRRHVDHLRPYHSTRMEEAQPSEYETCPTTSTSDATVPTEETVSATSAAGGPPRDAEQHPEESARRYPVRDRRAPERLM